jgi:hypothetical protein
VGDGGSQFSHGHHPCDVRQLGLRPV